jgi:hypothetical protein
VQATVPTAPSPATYAPVPTQQTPAALPQRAPAFVQAAFCCDMAGMRRCPLVNVVPVGTVCVCPYQGTGISC